jgi:pimeloyl-ACP methyl ester carboxylesterase
LEKHYTLAGNVALPSSPYGTVLILLYSAKMEENKLVSYTIPADTGHFSFFVSKGMYYLTAFEDRNNNLSYDKGELVGYFGAPDKIVIPAENVTPQNSGDVLNLDMELKYTDHYLAGFQPAIDLERINQSVFVKFGQISSLDDKIFSAENGANGYWKPLTFLRDCGFGIYFLEPYDPEKIPVLFVHGALGTPEGWKNIVERLDRSRFQPWFYYYPSGFRLEDVADALNEIIKKIHETYGFKTLYITAHSMGGLVSRSFIMKNFYQDHQDYIKLFISISTPWNGHRLTEKGVKKAPEAVPSWHDMVPDSDFIRSVFQMDFPEECTYYLTFSFKGNCSLFLYNNDGTVELSSELDYRAQNDADMIFGFDEDHGSILISPEFLDYFRQILDEEYRAAGSK